MKNYRKPKKVITAILLVRRSKATRKTSRSFMTKKKRVIDRFKGSRLKLKLKMRHMKRKRKKKCK